MGELATKTSSFSIDEIMKKRILFYIFLYHQTLSVICHLLQTASSSRGPDQKINLKTFQVLTQHCPAAHTTLSPRDQSQIAFNSSLVSDECKTSQN